MSLNHNRYTSQDDSRFSQTFKKNSLKYFIKYIEKYFFANATLHYNSTSDKIIDLSIQLDCNLSLVEILNHANLGTWGNFKEKDYNPLSLALIELKQRNNIRIRVEEFSLFLKDTSVILKRTNNCNIEDELENILREISSHYLYITKGLSEKPYEIYIPIEEEMEYDFNINNDTYCTAKNYSEYWGIYFENQEEATIYDVQEAKHIPEELHLCMVDF